MSAELRPPSIDLTHEAPFRLAGLEVRPSTLEVLADGRRELLEPRVMQVLVALAARRGEVVSRDDLIQSCWGGRVVGEDAINRCISRLRRLGRTYGGFSVETVARVGHRLREDEGVGRRAALWVWAVAMLAIVTVAGASTWFLRDRISAAPRASDTRVAVLPFDTLSSGQEVRYFADGLRDEIVGVLSTNQVLAVSRTESLALRGPNGRQAIDRLGVGLLLDGTVQSDGKTVRVRVHLDDAREHVTLWSREFEGSASDPEVLQARVAGRTTDVTNWLLSDRYGLGAKIDRLTLAAYLEAGDEIQNGGGNRFVSIFRQVVARAPDFSYGHSGLAFALIEQDFRSAPPDQQPRILAEVKSEGRRALALDPRNGEGYAILASVTLFSAWRERAAWILRGLSADPDSPALLQLYSTFLADVGRNGEALTVAQRAVAAEPYWARARAYLSRRLIDVGRAEQGRSAMAHAARLWPDDREIKAIQLQLAVEAAPVPEAISQLDDWKKQPSSIGVAAAETWRVFLRARDSQDPDVRRTAARTVTKAAETGDFDRYDAVTALSMLGDIDGAFAQAERVHTAERLGQPYDYFRGASVFFAPATRPLRLDPRFIQLAARLGLVDYWRATGHWPDFCAEPDLPYDCRAEAARVTAKASANP